MKGIIHSTTQWKKRFKHRSLIYRVSWLSALSLSVYLLLFLVSPTIHDAWLHLGPRTPLGDGARTRVRVSAAHLNPSELESLKERLPGLPVHQIYPRLKLVGIGERLVGVGEDLKVEFGIFPQYETEILRKNSQVSLRVQAPSLELLIQDLIQSKRGTKLKTSAEEAQARILGSWDQILPEVQRALETHVQPDLLQRMIADEVITNSLKNAFLTEVSDQIDLTELGETLEKSPALSRLGSLAYEHVSVYEVLGDTFSGGVETIKKEMKTARGDLKESWSNSRLLYDGLRCGLEIAILAKFSGLLGGGVVSQGVRHLAQEQISAVTPCTSKQLKRVGRGIKATGLGALKSGAVSTLSQSVESLKKNSNEAQMQVQVIARDVQQELQLGVKLKGFWTSIVHNVSLRHYIIETYGERAWSQLKDATLEVSTSDVVGAKVQTLSQEMKLLGQQGLTALLLDREGRGPNPLLLSVIQEQLNGDTRPMIHIRPNGGPAVKSGFEFIHKGALR